MDHVKTPVNPHTTFEIRRCAAQIARGMRNWHVKWSMCRRAEILVREVPSKMQELRALSSAVYSALGRIFPPG
ncbi:MAG TPA: hypothetical protein VGB55_09080 [Tepidisphaeraceae bacterium]|jgi:hypothetical protein